MKLEKLINNEIDEFLENRHSSKLLIINVADYGITEVDDINWNQITYFPVIDDALLKDNDLIIKFKYNFIKQHFDKLKKQHEEECRDLEREYWNSRF